MNMEECFPTGDSDYIAFFELYLNFLKKISFKKKVKKRDFANPQMRYFMNYIQIIKIHGKNTNEFHMRL